MTALEEMSVPKPRPADLCKRYARRMDPWWGFVLAGIIYTICSFVVFELVGMKLTDRLGYEAGSHGAQVVAIITLAAAAVTTFLTFRWWRRSRLGAKELLVRDGDLVEVTVTGRPFQIGGSKTRTAVELSGRGRKMRCAFNRWFLPTTGDTIQILHHPGVPHLVAFDRNGSMYSGHVTG